MFPLITAIFSRCHRISSQASSFRRTNVSVHILFLISELSVKRRSFYAFHVIVAYDESVDVSGGIARLRKCYTID